MKSIFWKFIEILILFFAIAFLCAVIVEAITVQALFCVLLTTAVTTLLVVYFIKAIFYILEYYGHKFN